MYTPQEVREQSMQFERAVFGGYNMKNVDDFMAPLVEDYSALYKENAVLKSKLKVMVEKLEEYHEREEAMNKALLAAQKTADEMIVDTERKCARMLSDTEETMRQRSLALKKEMAAEAERVNRAKKTAAAFILHVEEQMHKAVEQLEQVREMSISPKEKDTSKEAPIPMPEPETPPIPAEQSAAQAATQIGLSISRIIDQNAEPMGSESMVWLEDEAQMGAPASAPSMEDTIVIRPIEQ